MKDFNVFMYDLALAPLTRDTTFRPAKTMKFDDEQKAIEFAKSVRHNWEHVTVNRLEDNEELVAFRGDDMFIESKRTRLTKDE